LREKGRRLTTQERKTTPSRRKKGNVPLLPTRRKKEKGGSVKKPRPTATKGKRKNPIYSRAGRFRTKNKKPAGPALYRRKKTPGGEKKHRVKKKKKGRKAWTPVQRAAKIEKDFGGGEETGSGKRGEKRKQSCTSRWESSKNRPFDEKKKEKGVKERSWTPRGGTSLKGRGGRRPPGKGKKEVGGRSGDLFRKGIKPLLLPLQPKTSLEKDDPFQKTTPGPSSSPDKGKTAYPKRRGRTVEALMAKRAAVM